MFVALSSFEVQNNMEADVKLAFRKRPAMVENHPGFIRLDVLSPIENPAQIWLLTYWQDEPAFKCWHKNHLKDAHKGIPSGLKLVPHSFKLQYFTHISS